MIRAFASFVIVAACLPQLAIAGVTPSIGVAKQVTSLVDQGGGINDVTFSFTVENLGTVALENIQVTDDLSTTFPAPVTYSIIGGPSAGGTLVANGAFDGSGDVNLLVAGSSTLGIGASAQITVVVRVDVNGAAGPYFNSASATADDAFGGSTSDVSDDGVDPDPDGDGNPNEPGENDASPILTVPVELVSFTIE